MPKTKTKTNKSGGKLNLKVIQRKAKNTVKDAVKVLKKVAPYTPPVIGFIPNKVLLDVATGKRTDGLLPPPVRAFLSKNGNDMIQSMVVVRTPIESVVKKLLSLISLGTYDKAVHDTGYDNALHLALFINGKYSLDKQEVLKLTNSNPIKKGSETMDVNLGSKSITFNELLDNTRKYMGDANFTNYSARNNNCQDFVSAVLKSNGLDNNELNTFIKQDAQAIFKKLPSFTEPIADALTNTGAVFDKVIHGESIKKKKKLTAWQKFLSKEMKGKTFKSKEESSIYLRKLSVKYQKLKK